MKILAPWRSWEFEGRSDLIDYAQAHGIAITSTQEKPYSIDQNIMHTSFEGGILEDPWESPPKDIFLLSVAPQQAPDSPTEIIIDFEAGIPVKVNDKAMGPVQILQELNRVSGANGVRACGSSGKPDGGHEVPGCL